jgi:NMD protein affecting ribosome stability and mRNA decay
MKAGRNIFRAGRREELMTPLREDSYREDAKYHEPTSCPDCGATYVKGRWTWAPPAPESVDRRCPACERIHDDFPAGYVMLKGGYAQAHRDEVLAMVRGCETREKAEHPLERIMGIVDTADGIQVTTTDGRLARGIARALHDAFKGSVKVTSAKEENLVRAVWERRD